MQNQVIGSIPVFKLTIILPRREQNEVKNIDLKMQQQVLPVLVEVSLFAAIQLSTRIC